MSDGKGEYALVAAMFGTHEVCGSHSLRTENSPMVCWAWKQVFPNDPLPTYVSERDRGWWADRFRLLADRLESDPGASRGR